MNDEFIIFEHVFIGTFVFLLSFTLSGKFFVSILYGLTFHINYFEFCHESSIPCIPEQYVKIQTACHVGRNFF